jgi:predicted dehydrogenase/threonine dehydrogenase-like Zn-dependent dehydrogenase
VKNLVRPLGGGLAEVIEVPRPVTGPAEVLVAAIVSVISPEPLGCSAAGEVVEVGGAIAGIRPGQLVAIGSAGTAGHAEFRAVPGLLCAVIPAGVPAADAAFTAVAAVALHGLRLAAAGPGSKVVVVGLGLVGQLAARLAGAAGCDVAGIDPSARARATAARSGALALDELGEPTTERVLAWSRGRGADAVLVCAATASSGPVLRAAALCRGQAPVVVVGEAGLELTQASFGAKEISLRFARSAGPGHGEPSYAARGADYPAGQVRWSEGRNFEAVLDLLATGRLQVADLVTHSCDIAAAADACWPIESGTEPCLAIQLTYPARAGTARGTVRQLAGEAVHLGPLATGRTGTPGVSWIGAGAFSAGTLLPAFRAAGFDRLVAVASASGATSRRAAEQHGFARAVSGGFPAIDDADTEVVVIAAPHETHAELATLALRSGRHVWCEKPLALTLEELDEVERAWRDSGRQLMIGFNRRWSPAVAAARRVLGAVDGPKLLAYRVAAGPLPAGHWYHDRRQGGRVVGEVCQFVDTAQALIGAPIQEASGLAGGGEPGGGAVVSLRFADGSLATIAYGSVRLGAGQERIEVTGGGHQVVIDDFRRAEADGKTIWKGRQDFGHRGAVAAFYRAVTGPGSGVTRAEGPGPGATGAGAAVTETMLSSMAATIRAAAGGSRG